MAVLELPPCGHVSGNYVRRPVLPRSVQLQTSDLRALGVPRRCNGLRALPRARQDPPKEYQAGQVDCPRPRGPPEDDLCQPSTSGSALQFEELDEASRKRTINAMLAAPLVAPSFDKAKEFGSLLKKTWKAAEERILFERLVPPVGMETISYARFMELMFNMKVKRIIILAEGTAAIVEVPAPGFESDQTSGVMDRFDDFIMYGKENPEWAMEKIRYYCELPGDFWEDGSFMQMLKENMNPQRGEDGRLQYAEMRKFDQVHPELQVLDPNEALPFMGEFVGFFQPMFFLVVLQVVLVAGQWIWKKVAKKKKDAKQELMEQYGAHRAMLYNIGQSSKDTGVRYKDVAGVDEVKADITEVMKMVLGDTRYQDMGAKPPRGILLEGPPGTGKTYLAKAMAGDSGLPFYSAVGSEFVEMFQGVAAARVRDLFKAARATAPSIIFIDEIDALGRARSAQADSGSQEREQGLLQLLYEMDGMKIDDKVLVIGATNRKNLLDEALLRPGRFDRSIYMGRPTVSNRVKILQVHAEGKPIPHEGSGRYPEEALLHQTAERTVGYSGAELAGLLNEASILAVRHQKMAIDLDLITEAIDKRTLGLSTGRLPDTEAKRRLATVEAGRAVVLALTPGIPQLERLSIAPRGPILSRLSFVYQEDYGGRPTGREHQMFSGAGSNAVEDTGPLGDYEIMCAMLVPMYAARATEIVFYGERGATLSTAPDIGRAGALAHWLVEQSSLHPLVRDLPVLHSMLPIENTALKFERHTARLIRTAYSRALDIIRERQDAIRTIAAELCDGSDLVEGSRIVELVRTTPVQKRDGPAGGDAAIALPREGESCEGSATFSCKGSGKSGLATFGVSIFQLWPRFEDLEISSGALADAAQVVLGRTDLQELTAQGFPKASADEVHEELQRTEVLDRLRAIRKWSDGPIKVMGGQDAPSFPPPPPDEPVYQGDGLTDWSDPAQDHAVIRY
ncbi:hypothetical protein WJX73_000984 [Symbiochloris irregularis]|uniref:AAA+ ATPase domain-containing protein n=1 Tax=Symbiochloris irregularis TaxID=706552 RepID=A0AAW1PF82_9CHLO